MRVLRDRLTQSLLKAIGEVPEKYKQLAGRPANEAPEYFVSCQCAAEIRRLQGVARVELEAPITRTLGSVGADGRRLRHQQFAGNKRFDLVVWNKGGPFALIEIKHSIRKAELALRKDAIRLARALLASTNVNAPKYGYLAFDFHRVVSRRWPRRTLQEQSLVGVGNVLQSITYYLQESRLPVAIAAFQGDEIVEGENSWLPMAYVIRRKAG